MEQMAYIWYHLPSASSAVLLLSAEYSLISNIGLAATLVSSPHGMRRGTIYSIYLQTEEWLEPGVEGKKDQKGHGFKKSNKHLFAQQPVSEEQIRFY